MNVSAVFSVRKIRLLVMAARPACALPCWPVALRFDGWYGLCGCPLLDFLQSNAVFGGTTMRVDAAVAATVVTTNK
jgi:hypothetical protein